MATPTSEWMTKEQLVEKYQGLWVEGRSALTISKLDAQLEKGEGSGKCVVFAMATDKPVTPETKVAAITVGMKTCAARKKDGVWRFSEDAEDIEFVMVELSGLTLEAFREAWAKREERVKMSFAGAKL